MGHEVFISYATADKPVADAVCHALEEVGVRCWVAPRDLEPGRPYARCIMEAIEASSLMLLIFSQAANESDHIAREVELAARERKPLLPVRVAEVLPNQELVYFLGRAHWLDAFTPPVERHFGALIAAVRRLVERGSDSAPAVPLASPSLPPRPVAGRVEDSAPLMAPIDRSAYVTEPARAWSAGRLQVALIVVAWLGLAGIGVLMRLWFMER